MVKNLNEVHFAMVSPALLRCSPKDFGAMAAIDSKSSSMKVALIVALHLGTAGESNQGKKRGLGGSIAVCTPIRNAVLEDLS